MACQFKNVNTEGGLSDLNKFLSSHSYIEGYRPSQHDICVFKQLTNIHNADSAKVPHVIRWFNHINAFTPSQRTRFPGEVKEEKKCDKAKECGKAKECDKAKECSKAKECDKAKECTKADEAADAEKEEEEEKVMGWSDNDSDDEDQKAAQKIIDAKAAEKIAKDKAAGKKAVIARSTLILDVKPEGSETDMAALEANVRAIEQEGLDWKGSELVPVAYGVKKLRIISVIVDDLVSTDDLRERIEQIEDVQSTDIYAFNKV
jgi:elongation factor 1-beta